MDEPDVLDAEADWAHSHGVSRWATVTVSAVLAVVAVASCSANSINTGASGRFMCSFGTPGDGMSADGLPNVAAAVTDRRTVERLLEDNRAIIEAAHPEAIAIDVGPGYGRAWTGVNGGETRIVKVHDWAITVHLRGSRECPRGRQLATVPVNDVRFVFYQVKT